MGEKLVWLMEPKEGDKYLQIYTPTIDIKIDYDDVPHAEVLKEARNIARVLDMYWPEVAGEPDPRLPPKPHTYEEWPDGKD